MDWTNRQWQEIVFYEVFRPALEPTHPPIQWISGTPSLGISRRWSEADHSSVHNAKVTNKWNYISTPPYARKACTGTTSLLVSHLSLYVLRFFEIIKQKDFLYSSSRKHKTVRDLYQVFTSLVTCMSSQNNLRRQ
jgi:hypothetical protein